MADDSEMRMRYGYEGDEEEKPKSKEGKGPTKYIIIGIILVAVIAFIFLVPGNYKIIVGIAAIVLAYFWFSAPKGERTSRMILIGAAAVFIIVFFPQIQSYASEGYTYASSTFTHLKSGGTGIEASCMIPSNFNRCFGEGAWKATKSEQYIGGALISVDWANSKIKQSEADIFVSASTDKPLSVVITCFTNETSFAASPSMLRFEKGDTSSKEVKCLGKMTGKIGLKMGATLNSSLTTYAWIGGTESKGALKQATSGEPYNLEISAASQPIKEGSNIYVEFTKYKDANLTRINSFEVITTESFGLSCPSVKGTAAELAEYKSVTKSDSYIFTCSVDNVEAQEGQQTEITVKVDYSVEALYMTNLNIQK